MKDLADEIRSAAMHLPSAQLATLVDLFEASETAGVAKQKVAAIPHPVVRDVAGDVVTAWAHRSPELPGAAIALAVRASVATSESIRKRTSVEPVWTGPESPEIAVRLTRAALLEVIGSARQRVILVSFAAYKVPALIDALKAAHARGADVRLVLETAEDSAGGLSVDAGEAFAALKAVASFWVWPAELRPAYAKLHAKAAIADEESALVSSANLTGSALDHNMELGLLVRGGPIPRRLARHFMTLMDHGTLVRRVS